MPRIFATLLLAALALLGAAGWSALSGSETHARFGLVGAIAAVLVHSAMFVYLIGTSKTVKAAVAQGRLDPSFVEEGKRVIALAVAPGSLGPFTITAAAVLAGVDHSLVRRVAHPLLAVLALVVNAWAFLAELRVVTMNRDRLVRAAAGLLPLPADARQAASIALPPPGVLARALFLAGISFVSIFLYLRFVAREPEASPLPWVVLGALGVFGGLLVGRIARARRA
jgi:hypothetical protein